MTVLNYYFDETKAHRPYVGSRPANPGSFPPANAVREAPPGGEGQWPCLSDGVWVLVEDHRGEKGYVNRQPFEIKEVGPWPDGWETELVPTPEELRAGAESECLGNLSELDYRSTRCLRTIEVLRARLADGEEVQADLDAELGRLKEIEDEAEGQRALLAEIREAATWPIQ
jgi:hypothetical protein